MGLSLRVRRSSAAAAAFIVLVSSSPLAAQTVELTSTQRIADARRGRIAVRGDARSGPAVAPSTRRDSSVGMKILGGALGGLGGFFAGGFLGAKIEGNRCNCDDPGLMGFLIGAPVGATVGAIVGVKLASR